MTQFAAKTSVSPEKSKAEIELILRRYGADQFVSGWEEKRAVIGFRKNGKTVRFNLPLPAMTDFKYSEAKRLRTKAVQETAWQQSIRQRWRALALAIKAKLEAVESGITTFESEFLPYIVLPSGSTVSEWLVPQLDAVYRTAMLPNLLPGAGESEVP